MNDDQRQFLSLLRQPPMRLTADQVAWAINCAPHDIPVLVSARLLKPLGTPAPNGTKFFATAEILQRAQDRSWLAKVTSAVQDHWRGKNALKCQGPQRGGRVPVNGARRVLNQHSGV